MKKFLSLVVLMLVGLLAFSTGSYSESSAPVKSVKIKKAYSVEKINFECAAINYGDITLKKIECFNKAPQDESNISYFLLFKWKQSDYREAILLLNKKTLFNFKRSYKTYYGSSRYNNYYSTINIRNKVLFKKPPHFIV